MELASSRMRMKIYVLYWQFLIFSQSRYLYPDIQVYPSENIFVHSFHNQLLSESKFGSGRKHLRETSFFRQVGHSWFPLLKAVVIHSEQNRCKQFLVTIVFSSMSRQIGQVSRELSSDDWTVISLSGLSLSFICKGFLLSSYRFYSSSRVLAVMFTDFSWKLITGFLKINKIKRVIFWNIFST